jgi:hypothetical protein
MKAFLLKVLAAIGKFLKWGFASQVTIAVFGVIDIIAGHALIGLLIITWGVLLAINDFKQGRV